MTISSTHVDFYVLLETTSQARLNFACQLLEKIYQEKQSAYVHTGSQHDAQTLDALLWTYRDDAFIPHALYAGKIEPNLPIYIGFANIPDQSQDILLNLTQTIPTFYPQFKRVIEIVTQEPNSLELSRQHYKLYRQQGCELQSHHLKKP